MGASTNPADARRADRSLEGSTDPSQVLSVHPEAILYTAEVGISLLALVAYREANGQTGAKRLVLDALAILALELVDCWSIDLLQYVVGL